MERSKIQQIILDAIEMINNLRDNDDQIPVSESTELFGSDGHLDSMGLVGLIMDIEESMQDEGFGISLSDDRAMSQKHSPFKNVTSLTNYIELLLAGE